MSEVLWTATGDGAYDPFQMGDAPPVQRDDLIRIREALGLTQEQLAQRANVSTMTVSRMERGLSIHARSAKKLAAALGYDLGAILDPDKRPVVTGPRISWAQFIERTTAVLGETALPREVEERLRFAYDEYVKQVTAR